jgi:hypothetical protein
VAYDGYEEVDRWITNIAGICAIGVAFFPTKPAVCPVNAGACPPSSVTHLSTGQQVAGDVHVFFAAATFIALALMALRFAKAERTPDGLGTMSQVRHALGLARLGDNRSRPNNWDDVVYRFCGFTIIGSVVLAALSNLLPTSVKANWPSLFVFEALAVFAFGVSWFVKGRTMGVLSLRASRAAASLVQIRPSHESHRPAAN